MSSYVARKPAGTADDGALQVSAEGLSPPQAKVAMATGSCDETQANQIADALGIDLMACGHNPTHDFMPTHCRWSISGAFGVDAQEVAVTKPAIKNFNQDFVGPWSLVVDGFTFKRSTGGPVSPYMDLPHLQRAPTYD